MYVLIHDVDLCCAFNHLLQLYDGDPLYSIVIFSKSRGYILNDRFNRKVRNLGFEPKMYD